MSQDDGKRQIRDAIEGAGRGFQVIDGGKSEKRKPPNGGSPDDCPITALGHLNGNFHFLDINGQHRVLTARQLGTRSDLLSLFLGRDEWLRKKFPKRAVMRNAGGAEEEIVVDFMLNRASASLQAACGDAGLFGDHVVLRRPGIWTDSDGAPAVHCGDAVLLRNRIEPIGSRLEGQVWVAAAPTPRPTTPCEAAIARELQEDIRHLWNFRAPGSEIILLGLLGIAYFGAAARWRPAGFIMGGAGSGKSALIDLLRACCPLHHYTNDTSKAGVEQEIAGRAMPIFIDEASDREDQRSARALLDIVLSASGGEGTRGFRGSVDGKARKFELVGSIIMGGVAPPEMKPQHVGRFALIELMPPHEGADHLQAQQSLIARVRKRAPALWGRALGSWDRFQSAFHAYRAALSRRGCAPREMDQLGALLAAWWVLVAEGVVDDRIADAGVAAATEFVRPADELRLEDGPRRVVQHLFSTLVQLDRSTEKAQVGILFSTSFSEVSDEAHQRADARRILANYGIRPVSQWEVYPPRKDGRSPVLRLGDGDGVWLACTSRELNGLFKGTEWEGTRWLVTLRQIPGAKISKKNVRIGGLSGRALWIARSDIEIEEDLIGSEIDPGG